jgi:hypothetical protein
MMTIRRDLIAALAPIAEQRFVIELSDQLRGLFPWRTQRIGPEGVRDVIEYGIERARRYGIVQERDVGRYVAIMFMFGPTFDDSPSYRSLATVLCSSYFPDSRGKTDRLCECAVLALKQQVLRTGRKPRW